MNRLRDSSVFTWSKGVIDGCRLDTIGSKGTGSERQIEQKHHEGKQ